MALAATASTERPVHPAAAILPLLVGAEFDALVIDIRDHGLREPIVLHPDGSILDGRNRDLACERAGVEPRYITWDGEAGDEGIYVASMNLHRRHLNPGQRAMFGAKLANLRDGQRADSKAATPMGIAAISIPQAAEIAGASVRSVTRARTVLEHGDTELIEAVATGGVALRRAAEMIDAAKRAPRSSKAKGVTPRQERAKFWADFRSALDVLTALPDPADVIPGVPGNAHDYVARRLPVSIRYLTDFSHKWSENGRSRNAQ